MKLYEKLSALRKSNNYTQEQIAKKLGVTRQTVSKWEMGLSEPSLDLLSAIADIYNCTVDELLGRENIEKPTPQTKENENTVPVKKYKQPFWDIYKEAFLVLILGAVLTIIYFFVNRYSLANFSIIVCIAIECPVYLIGTIITVCGDGRIKTKGGILDLIIPLILVLGVQITMGVILEH